MVCTSLSLTIVYHIFKLKSIGKIRKVYLPFLCTTWILSVQNNYLLTPIKVMWYNKYVSFIINFCFNILWDQQNNCYIFIIPNHSTVILTVGYFFAKSAPDIKSRAENQIILVFIYRPIGCLSKSRPDFVNTVSLGLIFVTVGCFLDSYVVPCILTVILPLCHTVK